MKKSILFAVLTSGLMGTALAQNDNGSFSMRYSGGVAETNLEAFCRTQLPKLCEGTTFEIVSDETTRQGVRHVKMQQYVNGVRINGKIASIHMRDGKILSIDGSVMTQDQALPASGTNLRRAPRPATEIMQMAGLPERLGKKAELVVTVKDGVAHQAYRVLNGWYRMLIDAQTGEVLAKKSIILNWGVPQGEVVKGKGMTFYQGEQELDVARLEDGSYTLLDYDRKNYTLNASYEALISNGMTWNDIQTFSGQQWPLIDNDEEIDSAEILEKLASYCSLYQNDEPAWMTPGVVSLVDSLSFHLDDPNQSPVLGKYVFAELYMGDDVYRTDTVLVSGPCTTLHLPKTLEYDSKSGIIVFNTYSPDLDEAELHDVATFSRSNNLQTLLFTKYLYPETDEEFNLQQQDILTNGYLNVHNYTPSTAPMIDVHWGMQKVLDYYQNVFELNSFDGMGNPVFSLVNPPETIFFGANACAIPLDDPEAPGIMMYGLGGMADVYYNAFVDLATIGHEFTHLVARGLMSEYPDHENYHPGALNESFADIMGFALERTVTGNETWIVNGGVMPEGTAMRYFDQPELLNDPSCYLDENFDTTYYEVHRNAGVQNHMFYLLVEGGEGINSLGQSYAVTPMDRTEAEYLTFNTLKHHTCEGMSYEQVAEAWVNTAIELFGEDSPQVRSTRQAWAAVGLGEGDIVGIEQLSASTQKRGLRYNLQGQQVGSDYTGVVIEL